MTPVRQELEFVIIRPIIRPYTRLHSVIDILSLCEKKNKDSATIEVYFLIPKMFKRGKFETTLLNVCK